MRDCIVCTATTASKTMVMKNARGVRVGFPKDSASWIDWYVNDTLSAEFAAACAFVGTVPRKVCPLLACPKHKHELAASLLRVQRKND